MGDLSAIGNDKDAMKERVAAAFPNAKRGAIPGTAGTLLRRPGRQGGASDPLGGDHPAEDSLHASANIVVGVDLVYLSRQMGHSNSSVTLNVYADLFEASKKADTSRKALEDSGYVGLI